MKTLILSCNTGGGHNSAAMAIKETIDSHSDHCDVIDALSFAPKWIDNFVCNWYLWLYRYLPKVWDRLYCQAGKHSDSASGRFQMYRLLSIGKKQLHQHMRVQQYDTVVCTHVFAALILTEVLRKYPIKVHTSFVSTDYTCSPTTGSSRLDTYFIPHADLTEEFASNGIPKEKMVVAGIPIKKTFSEKKGKKEAKTQLGLPVEKKNMLYMCGSMGCGIMEDLVIQLVKDLPKDVILTIICGENKTVHRHLQKKLPQKNIHLVGYTNQMSLYMDSAELYLTKPGGLSISEALVKDLPMILTDVVAGCESYNLRFFLRQHWAETADGTNALTRLCVARLSDNQIKPQNTVRQPSAEVIYQTLKTELNSRKVS